MTTIYKPGNVPSDPRLIPTFLRGELAALKRGLESPEPITRRQVLHAPPAKAMDGDEIEADGVDWNPGYGPGKYVRRNGAWTRGDITGSTGTFSGALSAATGTFAGSLSAATGTFAGSLSAATGTFAGSLSAATGTFAGALSAATGTFSGSVSVNGTSGLALTDSSTTVAKVKLDASSNVLIQSEVANKSIALLSPNAGGLSVDDFTSAGVTSIFGRLPGGTNATLLRMDSTRTIFGSQGRDLELWAGTVGANTLKIWAGDITFVGSGKLVKCTSDLTAGNASGNVPVSNGTLNTNLNAQYLNGNASTAFATSGHNHSGTYLSISGTATNADALGGVAPAGYARIVNGNVGTATASGGGYTMQMGTGLAPTYEVNCSSNNIILQTASDRTLKQDIEDEALGLAFVKALRPRKFRFISDPEFQQHGFIAQEVAEIATPAGQKDALAFMNPNGKMGINHLSLIGPLVKAVQELEARLAALEARP